MSRLAAGGFVLMLAAFGAGCEGDTTVNVPPDPVSVSPEVHGITVTGVGEARGIPDLAIVSIGIDASAPTVAGASAKGADAATKLIATLKANDIADEDIRTQHVALQPMYEYPQNAPAKLTGYQVVNQLSVTIRNLASAGKVIDDASAAAGDTARMQGIQFGSHDPEALMAEARANAMEDARARAETYAAGAGVKVGEVEFISEFTPGTSPYPRPPSTGSPGAFEAGTPIQPGQNSTSVAVTVRFGIAR